MTEFLHDLRENWNDSYWWADHQWLTAILVGLIGLAFTTARIILERKLAPDAT